MLSRSEDQHIRIVKFDFLAEDVGAFETTLGSPWILTAEAVVQLAFGLPFGILITINVFETTRTSLATEYSANIIPNNLADVW